MIKLQYIVNKSYYVTLFFIYFNMKLKYHKKKTIGSHISREIIIIVLSLFVAIMIINSFYDKFNKVMLPLAEAETKKYMVEIINDATEDIKFDKDLFKIEKGIDGKIEMINYNSYVATTLINNITNNIQSRLDNNEDIIARIPLGIIFKNSLMRNFGPIIDVRMKMLGNVLSELETEMKPYGINNAIVTVRIKLNARAQVILPILSKEIKLENVIPLSINIVNGSIPEAYISSYK